MRDVVLTRLGRASAVYAIVAGVVATGLYVSLGLTDQLVREWIVHGALGGVTIGALVWLLLPRQPRNAAVWILVASAVFQATNVLALAMAQWRIAGLGLPADLTVLVPADLPTDLALLLQLTAWVWVPGLLMVSLALLLFPDGRSPSPRWRWAGWWTVVSLAMLSGLLAWNARPSREIPVYVDGGMEHASSTTAALVAVGMTAVFSAVVLCLVGLACRYRASTGLERQQFRWIAWSASVLGVSFIVLLPLVLIPSVGARPAQLAAIALFPLFVGAYVVAVARYRLYEIDRLISRTASYAIVTATLALIYLGLVLSLQVLLAPFTDGSELAVAGSTLVVAAAFVPLRNRVQSVVDRRFNRNAQDAQRAVAVFARGLRDEVELDVVQRQLATAASEAVEPAHAGVWLASPWEDDEPPTA